MKGIIVYKSVYGCTKDYARWLQEDLQFDSVSLDESDHLSWSDYDTIIIGSPVLMNRPFLSKWISKHWSEISHAGVFLYTTSGAPPFADALSKGYKESLPAEIRNRVEYFPLPGKFDYRKLNLSHKIMMNIGVLIQKDPRIKESMRQDILTPNNNV